MKSFEDAVTAVTSDEEFADTLNDYVTGASNKGVEWLHVYYDKAGMLQYVVTPAEEVIPFYDSVYQKELVELIRYYSVAVVADGKETLRKKVEWWTKDDVTYYEESESGEYILDLARSPNPSAHWYRITTANGLVTRREPHGWGRVPFIPLYNNGRHASDLTRIKGLQDAYNLISSASTNNQIDLVELYWIVQGYGGETAKAIQRKLQMNKAVSISDPQARSAPNRSRWACRIALPGLICCAATCTASVWRLIRPPINLRRRPPAWRSNSFTRRSTKKQT